MEPGCCGATLGRSPERAAARREGSRTASAPPSRRAQPRGARWGPCRLCNLLPAPAATRTSLARCSLVQHVGQPCQQGVGGTAGGRWRCLLPPPPFCAHQTPLGQGGLLWAVEQPLRTRSQALSQPPCGPDLDPCLSFPLRGGPRPHPAPGAAGF